ncbi:MAG: DUF3343 domain-containing protein [Tissierellaceae bacterium]|nr:DUF3343 domain-containing protein [Tissierellaceae bacterium]
MKSEVYGLITFKSTNYALQGEQVFKENNFVFKTIPTPRDVSTSCGLSLLFLVEDVDKAKELINQGILNIDGMFMYTKSTEGSNAEKIM